MDLGWGDQQMGRADIDGPRQFFPALLGFLGQAATAVGAYKAIEGAFAGGGAPSSGAPSGPQYDQIPGYRYPQAGGVQASLPIGPAVRAGAAWIARIASKYGPVIANIVWETYQELTASGAESSAARREAMKRGGVKLRRRMNPTNIRALRRAVRRARSFQRVSGKVQRLFPRRRVRGHTHYHRHPRRRGDLSPFYAEDVADVYDEWEDFGYDPAGFPEDGDDRE
jgi:hypothetical protein